MPGVRCSAVPAQLERRGSRYERLHALAPGTGLAAAAAAAVAAAAAAAVLLPTTTTTTMMSMMRYSRRLLLTPPQAEVFAARDDAKAAKRVPARRAASDFVSQHQRHARAGAAGHGALQPALLRPRAPARSKEVTWVARARARVCLCVCVCVGGGHRAFGSNVTVIPVIPVSMPFPSPSPPPSSLLFPFPAAFIAISEWCQGAEDPMKGSRRRLAVATPRSRLLLPLHWHHPLHR